MAENLVLGKEEKEDNYSSVYYDLVEVIRCQTDVIVYLNDVDYDNYYDEGKEDKIRCLADSFKVIAAAQKALIKQIKNL